MNPIQQLIRELEWEAEQKYLAQFPDRWLLDVWEAWDGVSLMVVGGRPIDEHAVWVALANRGLETGI